MASFLSPKPSQPDEQRRKLKGSRKPVREIYARPLPLNVHPLPSLTPNNPLSFIHIAYVLLSEYLRPPSSHSGPCTEQLKHSDSDQISVSSPHQRESSWWFQSRKHHKYLGYYDSYTLSVHVTDDTATRALWEQGFFGKGSLSRSEPEWLAREEARRRKAETAALFAPEKSSGKDPIEVPVGPVTRQPNGIPKSDVDVEKHNGTHGMINGHIDDESNVLSQASTKSSKNQTSAEVTNKRREERREEKRQRAKREAEAIEEQLRVEKEESNGQTSPVPIETQSSETNNVVIERRASPENMAEISEQASAVNGDIPWASELTLTRSTTLSDDTYSSDDKAFNDSRRPSVRFAEEVETIPPDIIERKASMVSELQSDTTPATAIIERPIMPPKTHPPSFSEPLVNQEHLQLSCVEAFFLVYALGILTITSPDTETPLSVSTLLDLFRRVSYHPPLLSHQDSTSSIAATRQDDPFLLSYVVYHHFRSLGWVVRPGIKFAVDFLLYNRGPVFSHAEFAVLILPSYSHPYWQRDDQRSQVKKKENKDWWWLHCANRVQTQVRKSLVLVYVDIPPPSRDCRDPYAPGFDEPVDVGALLKGYKIREFVIGRWSMNRNRD